MDANAAEVDRHSFVVRVWSEVTDGQAGTVAWRGCVDHVGTGHRLYFSDLEAIARFVREQVGARMPGREHWWTHLWRWITRESTWEGAAPRRE